MRACVNACMRKYFGIFIFLIFFLPHNVLRAGHTLQKLIRNKYRCCHTCDDKQHLSVLLIRRWRIIITQFRLLRKRIKLLADDVIVLFHGLVYIIKSRKENPQKPTQLSSRSHPRHLVGKRTAQKTPS